MPVTNEKRQEIINRYKARKTILDSINRAVNEIIEGEPEQNACKHENLDIMKFRRLLNHNIFTSDITNKLSNTANIWRWEEHFLNDLLESKDNYIPNDFQENYEYITTKALSAQYKSILDDYYKNNTTFREMTNKYPVSHQRLHQIIKNCLERLRHKDFIIYFLYDKSEIEQIQENNKTIKALNCTLEQQQIQINALKSLINNNDTLIDAITSYINANVITVTPIEQMMLSVRAYNCLITQNCKTSEDIAKLTLKDLYSIPGLGQKSANNIINEMHNIGYISFPSKTD